MKFKFWGEQEHREFNYKPIYFDREKDARIQKFGHVDGRKSETKEYVPGTSLKGAFRDGNYQRKKHLGSFTISFLGITGLVLLFTILYMIAKFYTLL